MNLAGITVGLIALLAIVGLVIAAFVLAVRLIDDGMR